MDPNNPDRHIQQGAEKVKRALMFGHRPSPGHRRNALLDNVNHSTVEHKR
jgi:hypothetical protein